MLWCLRHLNDLNDKNPFGLVGKTLLFHSKKIRFKSYSGYLLWNIAKQVKALIFDIDIIGSNPIIPVRSLRMYTRAQLVLKRIPSRFGSSREDSRPWGPVQGIITGADGGVEGCSRRKPGCAGLLSTVQSRGA